MAKRKEKTVCRDCLRGRCKIHSEPPTTRKRPSWDDYFMDLAKMAASRSTCLRHRLGAVLVADKRILSIGYNGAPRGIEHCLDVGCLRDKLKIPSGTRHEICMAIHAEQSAIVQAALHGVSTQDATMYVTHQPCAICTKMIINAGIKRVVFASKYPDEFAQKLFKKAKVKLVHLNAKGKKS